MPVSPFISLMHYFHNNNAHYVYRCCVRSLSGRHAVIGRCSTLAGWLQERHMRVLGGRQATVPAASGRTRNRGVWVGPDPVMTPGIKESAAGSQMCLSAALQGCMWISPRVCSASTPWRQRRIQRKRKSNFFTGLKVL